MTQSMSLPTKSLGYRIARTMSTNLGSLKRPTGASSSPVSAQRASQRPRRSLRLSANDEAIPATPTRTLATATPVAVTPDSATKESFILTILQAPPDFSLSQAICSYGYFGLAPNKWQPAASHEQDDDGIYERPLVFGTPNDEEHAAIVRVEQSACRTQLRVMVTGGTVPSTPQEKDQIIAQVKRIVRFDWSPQEFWEMNKHAKERGFGRTFRSPTLWEDMVKTLTNCNMQWSGTVQMNRQMCSELGHVCSVENEKMAAFPTPRQILEFGPDKLKAHCRVGYRAPWIVDLAAKFVNNDLDPAWIQNDSVSNEELFRMLTSLKGFGKFASSNVMQLLGRYNVFPLDTETTRLFREEFGVAKSVPVPKVHQKARDHYEQFAPYQFLAYWFDLWRNYEQRKKLLSPRWEVETCTSL